MTKMAQMAKFTFKTKKAYQFEAEVGNWMKSDPKSFFSLISETFNLPKVDNFQPSDHCVVLGF